MKLYTELQLRASYESGFKLAMETDGGLKEGQEEFINSITQIELPSDEEIEQEAYYKVSDPTENPYASFKSGAKWIKEMILNQSK